MPSKLCLALGRILRNRKVQMCLSCRNVLPWIIITVCFLGLQKSKREAALADQKCMIDYHDGQVINFTHPNAIISAAAADVSTSTNKVNWIEPRNSVDKQSPSFPFHPFVDGQSRSVVILSYQRCGSSFFSEMFNRNPRTFYFFEPIDSVYSSIYGTGIGWNVPSDITGHRNGSQRLLPDVETHEVSRFLISLLTCRVEELPMETLTHRFLYKEFYQEPNPYIRCISNETLMDEAKRCLALAPVSFCRQRFGEASEQRHDECYRLLSGRYPLRKHPKRDLFAPFLVCRKRIRQMFLDFCGPLLSKTCKERPIRAVKTVRATMESMEPLLSELPNFRVIHLIRDPRAVILSRKKFDASAKSLYSVERDLFMIETEAKLFCQTVVRDIRVRLELEKRFPGRIYTILYEDVMAQFKTYTGNVYAFLNVSSPVTSNWWRRKVGIQFSGLSRKVSHKWKAELTFRDNRSIVDNCAELFKLVGHNKWER